MINTLIITTVILLVLMFCMYIAYLIVMMTSQQFKLGSIRSFLKEFNKVEWDELNTNTCTFSFQKNYPKYEAYPGIIRK